MCGRFTFQPSKELYERFQISTRLDPLMGRYNIAPGQMVPVIMAHSPRWMVLMRWGLIPHGPKDAKTAYKMINAWVETPTQRPAFRGLLSHNRALVPACGYYEWQGEGRDNTPYDIHPQEDQYLAFAGLYDTWTTPDREDLSTFTISRPRRIPSWHGFTIACRSSWPESWKRPGWIQSSHRHRTCWTCSPEALAWN
jgi:putative SOS response-associated peptidase YedK